MLSLIANPAKISQYLAEEVQQCPTIVVPTKVGSTACGQKCIVVDHSRRALSSRVPYGGHRCSTGGEGGSKGSKNRGKGNLDTKSNDARGPIRPRMMYVYLPMLCSWSNPSECHCVLYCSRCKYKAMGRNSKR